MVTCPCPCHGDPIPADYEPAPGAECVRCGCTDGSDGAEYEPDGADGAVLA